MTEQESSGKPDYLGKMTETIIEIAEQNTQNSEILIRISSLAARMENIDNYLTIRRAGFPAHFDYQYDSCKWEYREGLLVKPTEFLEEVKSNGY